MDDFEYETKGGLTITGYTGPGGVVTIPEKIGGFPVTRIKSGAFWRCTKLTDIIIPDSVSYIEEKAFKYCSGLTKIYVPEETTIAEYAFVGCENLVSITHGDDPDQVYTAADFMFQYYTGTIKRKPRILPAWWTAQ